MPTPPPAADRTGTLHAAEWLEPLAAWLLTRALCLSAIYIGAAYWPTTWDYRAENPGAGVVHDLPSFYADYAREPDRFGRKPMLGLQLDAESSLWEPLVRSDAFWYLSIAEQGYVRSDLPGAQQNVAFFPLYPTLVRGTADALRTSTVVAALLISNGALWAAACLLYFTVRRGWGRAAARWTTWLWLLYPTSLFGSVPYTESLMALCTMLWLHGYFAQQYATAGWWAGLASAVRPQGALLGLALLEPLWSSRRLAALLGLALSVVGLAAYMAYLAWAFDDAWLFHAAQAAWRPAESATWNPLRWLALIAAGLAFPFAQWAAGQPTALLSTRVIDPYLLLWTIAWLPLVARRLGWGLALTTAAMIALPLSTGGLASLGRFTWLMVPVFVVVGTTLAEHRLRWVVAALMATLLIWLALLYGGGWMVI